jgi:hypothetical protein
VFRPSKTTTLRLSVLAILSSLQGALFRSVRSKDISGPATRFLSEPWLQSRHQSVNFTLFKKYNVTCIFYMKRKSNNILERQFMTMWAVFPANWFYVQNWKSHFWEGVFFLEIGHIGNKKMFLLISKCKHAPVTKASQKVNLNPTKPLDFWSILPMKKWEP